MRRWLYIAAFSLILPALPLWAQHRGGGGGGHVGGGSGAHIASHGGFAGHSSTGHASGAFHGGAVRGSGVHFELKTATTIIAASTDDGAITLTRDIIPTAITAGMPIRFMTVEIRTFMRMSIALLPIARMTARTRDCSATWKR